MDNIVSSVRGVARESEVWGGDALLPILSFSLLSIGIVLLLFGEKIVLPSAIAIAGVTVSTITFALSTSFPCEARVGASLSSGVVASLLSVCIIRTGIFVVGGASTAIVAHFVYESLPPPKNPPFSFLGKSAYYFATLAGAFLVGAVSSHIQRKSFMKAASSMLGSTCVLLSVSVAYGMGGESVPSVVSLAVLSSSFLAGIISQTWLENRRKRRKRDKSGQRTVVEGVPVRE